MHSSETVNTYSAEMRRLHKENPKKMMEFARAFKSAFDKAIINRVDDHQNIALLQAKHSIAHISTNTLVKLAQTVLSSSRNPTEVGASLAQMIKILIDKIPNQKEALTNVRNKILKIDPTKLSLSTIPKTAAYGQSITLVKTLLTGYSPEYINQVLTSVIKLLY